MIPYPKYKPSGVQWVDSIPADWSVSPLKHVAVVQPSNVDKKSVEGETKVLLCNYVDVYKNDFITDDIDFMKATASESQIEKFQLSIGDVLITKDSETPQDIAVPALVKTEKENLICGYHLAQIKPNPSVLVGGYLFRLFQSKQFNTNFEIAANGITRYGLGSESVSNVKIVLPPVQVQAVISDYLDEKTALIDTAITKKQKLIEILQEEKVAVINQAVTKGINPSVKLKHSGIDWLGDVPAHWEVKKLKYIAKINPQKGQSGFDKNNSAQVIFLPMEKVSEDGTYDSSMRKPISELWNGFTYFEENDVIVAKITPCFENGKGALLSSVETKIAFGSTEFHVLRAVNNLLPGYLFLITKSDRFMNTGEASMTGAAGQKRVPTDFFEDFAVALPSVSEQTDILSFVKKELYKITHTVSRIEKEIELLQEYKTALINEVVTGKMKITN
ncbi:MAG: restriction endonuclease subunit S [Flavipsychrobacter sp.]|nr:restriction endonuclease subunit S [Flavipsychrobacter sp.]